jgi:acetyltransferase-like isoleucine patch superfamily enzyme
MEQRIKVFKSAVRTTASFGLRHDMRRWWTTRGAQVGLSVHVDRNVRLLRHPSNVRIGDHVMLKEGVRICPAQPDAFIEVGENTTVGYHGFLFASAGISIGRDCLIAPFCYLVDANHGVAAGELIREQDMTASPISIGNGVWLGARVTVLSGVTIGAGAVVAAGAVVREDVPDNAIVAGMPAQIKGYRS